MVFILGTQLVYYGMKINGSDHLRGPVWQFVKLLHDLIIYSTIAALSFAIVFFVVVPFVLMLLPHKDTSAKKLFESKDIQSIPEADDCAKPRDEELIKAQEEQQKLEEQRKQEAIKRRRERSASAAAHDALDDFL